MGEYRLSTCIIRSFANHIGRLTLAPADFHQYRPRMKWLEFLNDSELNANPEYHGPPDGNYLFGKVAHDVRECLTGYQACLEIIQAQSYSLPVGTRTCLQKWGTLVEEWLAEIGAIVEQSNAFSVTSAAWPELIANIGKVVEQASIFKTEMESLVSPGEETARQVIQIAVRQTAKLKLLQHDIQAQEYKRLWMVQKYTDLVDND